MRKILVIALVSIHLFGNTEFAQLFRLPNLVHHYFAHSHINPKLSFSEFMAMHYGGDDGTDTDDDFDNKLPCHNIQLNTLTFVYSPMVSDLPAPLSVPDAARNYNSCLQTGISSKHVLLILQPPRLIC